MKTQKQITGMWGEEQAVDFLVREGYSIVDRNYLKRKGELDIIAWHHKEYFGNTLCFVEVKTRDEDNGNAERATGKEKMKSLFHTARIYCLEHHINTETTPIQFEQVSVFGDDESGISLRLRVIPVD